MRSPLLAALLIIAAAVSGFGQTATALVLNGDPSNRIDLVILGDGYTADELEKFATDAARLRKDIFDEEPFREYKRYFNVWRVDVASIESGSDHPERDPPVAKDTAFDSTYNCADIRRLICVDLSKVEGALSNVPLVQRDFVLMIVNDEQRGGSGGTIAVASVRRNDVLLHELGHSMAALADEYASSPPPKCINDVEPFQVNVTMETDPALIKWGAWIDVGTAIPTGSTENGVPGLYLGAKYCTEGLYRPTFSSKMRNSRRPFEQINEEQFVRTFYGTVSPIDAVEPSSTALSVTAGEVTTFSVSAQQPSTYALDVSWTVDGVASGSGPSFVYTTGSVGEHTVTVVVSDPTSRVRNDPNMLLRDQRSWVITVEPTTFSIPDRGGVSTTSSGTAGTLSVGYGRIRADAASTTPSGIAIFQFRNSDGVLISEAGVPATEPVQEGRIFAEVNGPVNTGLAIANPNEVPATIRFYVTDGDGIDSGHDSFQLGAGQQTARLLDTDPFHISGPFVGTLTFTSSAPVAVTALRGLTNEANEWLMTTLPVAPLSPAASDTVYFPHFADGGGWATDVVLVNPTDWTIAGTVGFLGPGDPTTAGAPVVLTLDDGAAGSEFDYTIAPRSFRRFTTSNRLGELKSGSVRATPDVGSAAPSGLVVFSYASGEKTLAEAGVPVSPEGTAFRVPVDAFGTPNQPGSIRTGLAVANTADVFNTVTLEVTRRDGTLAASPATLTLPPSGQAAGMLDEILTLPADFSGLLRVSSVFDVSVTALRMHINELGELKVTTTQPSNETAAATSEDRFFAHFADSRGWTTEFILFSGTAGQVSSGTLRFIDTQGKSLDLAVAPTGTAPALAAPDLAVLMPSVSDRSLETGESFTLVMLVHNQGNRRSDATTLRYYRSSNATISTGDMEVGTDAVSGLSASSASDESISLTAPSSAGTYYYGACVELVPGEFATGNNCSSAVSVRIIVNPYASLNLDSDHFFPMGITFANGRFHVVDFFDGKVKVYAYTATGQRDAPADFYLDSDNRNPQRMTFANGRFYLIDNTYQIGKVYAYTATGQRDAPADFYLDSDNNDPAGITFANGRFHVVDFIDDKVYAYTATGQHDAPADFYLDSDNNDPAGITFANGRFHVVDSSEKVYVYTATGQRVAASDFYLDPDNTSSTGITFANGRFYVVDAGGQKVYVYPLPVN